MHVGAVIVAGVFVLLVTRVFLTKQTRFEWLLLCEQ